MKTLYTTLTLLLTASITFAQETPNPTPPKMWQINSFGTHVGISSDVYQRMSMDHMRDFATNPSELTLDLDGYTEYAHAVITGVTLGGWITASKFNAASGEYRTNREVQLGANIITGRESAVEYEREEPTANGTEYHSVVYCDMESEVNLHGAYLFRTNRERKWNVFGGIGANIGATFNDAMLIIFNRYATDNNGTFIESSFDEEDVLEYGAKPSYLPACIFLMVLAIGYQNVLRYRLPVEKA